MIQSTNNRFDTGDRTVLAVVSQYADKYYLNEELGQLPEEVKKEVLVLLVMLTEEAGGISVMGFEKDGEVYLASTCEEDDLGYDEISAGLIIREIERDHADLLEQLATWFRRVVLRKKK